MNYAMTNLPLLMEPVELISDCFIHKKVHLVLVDIAKHIKSKLVEKFLLSYPKTKLFYMFKITNIHNRQRIQYGMGFISPPKSKLSISI